MHSLKITLKNRTYKTVWRLNNSLLQDKKFVERMQKILTEYVEINNTEDTDTVILWEGAKAGGHILSYSSAKKRLKKHNKNSY